MSLSDRFSVEGVEKQIEAAKIDYVEDRIGIFELEERIEQAFDCEITGREALEFAETGYTRYGGVGPSHDAGGLMFMGREVPDDPRESMSFDDMADIDPLEVNERSAFELTEDIVPDEEVETVVDTERLRDVCASLKDWFYGSNRGGSGITTDDVWVVNGDVDFEPIDDCYYHDRALSEDEVERLYYGDAAGAA